MCLICRLHWRHDLNRDINATELNGFFDNPEERRIQTVNGVVSENGIYGHSRFCNTDFDDKLACLNLSGV
ncbi:integrase [Klebsiella pneumoniae]|nr:integrase [Klebsiella pneumoniae]